MWHVDNIQDAGASLSAPVGLFVDGQEICRVKFILAIILVQLESHKASEHSMPLDPSAHTSFAGFNYEPIVLSGRVGRYADAWAVVASYRSPCGSPERD